MVRIALTVVEANHLYHLLNDAIRQGDYFGNREQYYKRQQRIMDKLVKGLELEAKREEGG